MRGLTCSQPTLGLRASGAPCIGQPSQATSPSPAGPTSARGETNHGPRASRPRRPDRGMHLSTLAGRAVPMAGEAPSLVSRASNRSSRVGRQIPALVDDAGAGHCAGQRGGLGTALEGPMAETL